MRIRGVFLIAAFVLLFGGYAFALVVAASVPPICSLIAEVGRERVTVVQLIPNGANPHAYEPTPSDVAKAAQAEAFFLVGLGFDTYLEKVIKAAKGEKALILYLHSGLDLLEDRGENHHEEANPHIWLSLRNAQVILETVARNLSSLDPEGANFYRENAKRYAQVLAEIDTWFTQEILSLPSRSFVATHNSLSYLARDYGLFEAGVLEKAPGYEPTPQELAELVTLMREKNVRIVVAEPQFSVKAAQVLAEETQSTLVFFDPLGTFPDTPYHVLMKENLRKLIEAWKGSGNDQPGD
ncbi:MAG: metal ABC transporter substrate-binding protein [Atribacterota bacterium]